MACSDVALRSAVEAAQFDFELAARQIGISSAEARQRYAELSTPAHAGDAVLDLDSLLLEDDERKGESVEPGSSPVRASFEDVFGRVLEAMGGALSAADAARVALPVASEQLRPPQVSLAPLPPPDRDAALPEEDAAGEAPTAEEARRWTTAFLNATAAAVAEGGEVSGAAAALSPEGESDADVVAETLAHATLELQPTPEEEATARAWDALLADVHLAPPPPPGGSSSGGGAGGGASELQEVLALLGAAAAGRPAAGGAATARSRAGAGGAQPPRQDAAPAGGPSVVEGRGPGASTLAGGGKSSGSGGPPAAAQAPPPAPSAAREAPRASSADAVAKAPEAAPAASPAAPRYSTGLIDSLLLQQQQRGDRGGAAAAAAASSGGGAVGGRGGGSSSRGGGAGRGGAVGGRGRGGRLWREEGAEGDSAGPTSPASSSEDDDDAAAPATGGRRAAGLGSTRAALKHASSGAAAAGAATPAAAAQQRVLPSVPKHARLAEADAQVAAMIFAASATSAEPGAGDDGKAPHAAIAQGDVSTSVGPRAADPALRASDGTEAPAALAPFAEAAAAYSPEALDGLDYVHSPLWGAGGGLGGRFGGGAGGARG